MSSVTDCNCPQNTPDPACLRAVSSRPLDQQQKKPDGSTCQAGSVGRRLGDCWQNSVRNWCVVVGQIQRSLIVLASEHSTPSLYWTRSGTSSQCSSVCMSLDRPRSNFRVSLTMRMAAFNTRCSPLQWSSALQWKLHCTKETGWHESTDECGSRESSDCRMRWSCRSLKKPAAQTLATCLSRRRSD